ncbi:MAG: hypothetical protein AAFQ43_05460 [Bacteroidota bacterium]
MSFLAASGLISLGCGNAGAGIAEPAPTGSWRGTLTPLDGGRSLPANLVLTEAEATLIAGSFRGSGDEAVLRGERIDFTVDSFPVTTTLRRPLRCSVRIDSPQALSGLCRASRYRYDLRLVRSLS